LDFDIDLGLSHDFRKHPSVTPEKGGHTKKKKEGFFLFL
jgi:hypothetical protein